MKSTKKLAAVNIMLKAISEQPVDSLAVDLPEVSAAVVQLDQTLREFLAEGFSFNRESNYPFTPNADGEIAFSEDEFLQVDPVNRNLNYTVRDGKLYDNKNHTYQIGGQVLCNVLVNLEFDQLPEVARQFVAIRASRAFQLSEFGSGTLDKQTESAEQTAWLNLLRSEAAVLGANMFDDDPVFSQLRRR